MTKKILSILSLFLLVAGLITVSLVVRRQINLRSKAAVYVEGATLSLTSGATSGVKSGDTFDVVVNLAKTGTSYKITAANVVLSYPQDKFTLLSINSGLGTLFLTDYNAATMEMLNKPDAATAGLGKLAIGVPCTTSAPWVCYPSSAAATGQVATFRFQVKSAAPVGSATIGFDNTTAVAALDSAGNAIPTSILLGTTPVDITINPLCPAGQNLCSNVCKNLQTDPANCGTCGNVCITGQSCTSGTCTLVCPAGQNLCSGACKNLGTDPANCGTCGHACTTGQTCASGVCTSPASSTLTFGFKLLGTTTRTANVTLKSASQTLVFPNVALTASGGIFSPATPITLTGATTGSTYSVLVKSPGYLQKNLGTITITSGTNTGPATWNSIMPFAGDFDGNNVLNAMDVGNILGLYTAISVPVTSLTQIYDLDGNGAINALDVANTLANYTAISVSGDN